MRSEWISCTHHLEFLGFDCWDCGPKSRHALSSIVPCNAVHFGSIRGGILEMGEVEAICAIGVQFQKSRRNNPVFQIDSLAAYISFALEDAARLIGNDEVVFDELALENVAAVGEEGEPAGHGLDFVSKGTRNDSSEGDRCRRTTMGSMVADSVHCRVHMRGGAGLSPANAGCSYTVMSYAPINCLQLLGWVPPINTDTAGNSLRVDSTGSDRRSGHGGVGISISFATI